jgi:YwiC-like protein
MSFARDWQLPREHGAWGMIIIPFLLGATRWSWQVATIGVAAFFFFLARGPLLAWARAWHRKSNPGNSPKLTMLYLGVTLIAWVPVYLTTRLLPLLFFGAAGAVLLAINTWQALEREDRTVTGEFLAFCGLGLIAPATNCVAVSEWTGYGVVLWVLCVAYFSSAIFYVKMRVKATVPRMAVAHKRLRIYTVVYHVLLFASGKYAIAFLPVIARALWYAIRPSSKINLKQIGWTEVVYSIWFLLTLKFF